MYNQYNSTDNLSLIHIFEKMEDTVGFYNEDALATTFNDGCDIMANGEAGHWFMPVSYTHLDVYKRQHGIVNACMNNETMGCQRDGAFCEYITMPIERIYDGKGLPPKVLAAIEPFCISYHGVQRAGINKGDKVLVVGSGTIGVLAAVAAKALGGEVYISDRCV